MPASHLAQDEMGLEREVDPERGAFAGDAVDTDVAAVGADDLLRDPEAEPDSADAFRRSGALEAIEDASGGPEEARDTSSRSPTSLDNRWICSRLFPSRMRSSSTLSGPWSSSHMKPSICKRSVLTGVFNSWEAMERKSSRRWMALCAAR